ncbi:MAG: thrombospondin type 3 repeat-containing protein [Candidatus Magasanikbacteria bacterium]|nr:thrombospondin type 3 repeat-containing protein [Candidatus Magasanikbacteria bacterium]
MTRNKKAVILAVGCLVVILAIIVILRFVKKPGEVVRNKPSDSALQVAAEQQAYEELVSAKQATDQDLDGLFDLEEAKFGTNPKNKDSDSDGLTDYDEVKIFKTDPLKSDTYGLGHSDSWGVRNRKILPQGKLVK